MKYALVENGFVKDIFITPKGCCIEECFHEDLVSLYIPCLDVDIIEEDFYDSDTQKFSKNPNKKFPNHKEWITSLDNKKNELLNYFIELDSVILNNIKMYGSKIGEYEQLLSKHTQTQTKIEFELDLSIIDTNDANLMEKIITENEGSNSPKIKFSVDEFVIMVNTIKTYFNDCKNTYQSHISSIKQLNDAELIDSYNISVNWPKI